MRFPKWDFIIGTMVVVGLTLASCVLQAESIDTQHDLVITTSTSSSSTSSTSTTSTTAPPAPPAAPVSTIPAPRPTTSTAAPVAAQSGTRRVSSTAYCETGRTADGGRGYDGSVAMNGVPFGSVWRDTTTGKTFTVNDRIGHGSDFDIWMPSCSACREWGRRVIAIERIR